MAIRSDNDPSSAAPHPGIETGELEQYGVWVKAEPRDILEENGMSLPGDIDFDLPAESSPVSEEAFLSEDEERLLGTFDADFEAPLKEGPSAADLGPLPDIEDIPSRDGSAAPEPIDISLEDIESMRSPKTIRASSELDMSTIQGFDSIGAEEPSSPASFDAMEDVSAQFLDESDFSVPSPSQDSSPASNFGVDDVTSQFLVESEESIPLSRPVDTPQDFEPLDIDLQFEGDLKAAPSSASTPAASESGLEPISEFDDFIAPGGEGPVGGFDDLAAVEASLSEPSRESSYRPSSGAAGKSDLSSDLLLKIADELRSIRGELVSLKSQIGGLALSAEAAPKSDISADKASPGGFFDEEEDETIALTGDELDNILNTADFTEEAAEAASESLLEEPLLPESGVYDAARPSAAPAIEELRLGEADSVDEIEEVPPEDSLSDLVNVAEEGVRAMTSAPEDASYLENEGLSLDDGLSLGEGLALDGAPLADVPLVEPDLSEFDLETEEGGGLEVSEELPLAAEPADMMLDLDAGPGYGLDYQADEAEFLEPVPEVEESVYGEISLHEESKERRPSAPESSIDEVSDVEELEELADEGPASPYISPESISIRPEEVPVSLDESIGGDQKLAEAPSAEIEELLEVEEAEPPQAADGGDDRLKSEIRSVLSYLDKLLDSLPEEKIEEFARSEYFDTYKRLFEELGLV
jgi:hypothetical protein